MRFIDSNIIAYAFYENERSEFCKQALREGGTTNTVALVEAYNIIELQTTRGFATRAIKGLLKSNVKIVPADINLLFESLKKTEKYKKLNFLDLLHYTTACFSGCSSVLSYDKDFDGLEIKREEP